MFWAYASLISAGGQVLKMSCMCKNEHLKSTKQTAQAVLFAIISTATFTVQQSTGDSGATLGISKRNC